LVGLLSLGIALSVSGIIIYLGRRESLERQRSVYAKFDVPWLKSVKMVFLVRQVDSAYRR